VKLYEFLEHVHRAYQPRSYLEIGINTGSSLALSRTRTIAIDPAFEITQEIACDVQVVKATSDEFFARDDGLAHFSNRRIDLAFVDGLHLFEFALRDFMNVERHSAWTSVIVIDDVLPRNPNRARRNRGTLAAWPGDVFKITEVLTRYRPDLFLLSLDTEPTGVLLILGADRQSRVLEDHYDEIVAQYVYPDPQRVPDAVLRRETAIDPISIQSSDLWTDLRNAREAALSREAGWEAIRRAAESTARPAQSQGLTPRPRPIGATRPTKVERKSTVRIGAAPTIPSRAVAALRRRLRPLRRRL
jgi:hypothetical protein